MISTQLQQLEVVNAARALLGQQLVRTLPDGTQLSGRIVETEGYHQSDPASHCYGGKRTKRTDVMFGPAGRAYVYFTYGMHYCLNVVAGREGEGAAVLIRALEPLESLDAMRSRRGEHHPATNLCSGPAKLTQAFRIDKELNGHDLTQPPLQLLPGEEIAKADIKTTPRIGISRATDTPWRFYMKNNPYISK